MTKLKSLLTVVALTTILGMSATSTKAALKPKKCGFNGDYSFLFWGPNGIPVDGVGYFSVQLNPKSSCRSGVVLPGGIIDCYTGEGEEFEDFIEDGSVFVETDGEGTMEIETNSSNGICGTGLNALELDVSLVSGGKTALFSANGAQYASSGTIPQAGYFLPITGRADKCFAGPINGCYDIHFWGGGNRSLAFAEPEIRRIGGDPIVGDCTICVAGGFVTGGTCRCNSFDTEVEGAGFETLSEIETGGYTLGEDCQSSTGFMTFTVSSDEVCDTTSTMILDFAVAQQGNELIGACDTSSGLLCSFEGWKQ
jgi:hypothetical protein